MDIHLFLQDDGYAEHGTYIMLSGLATTRSRVMARHGEIEILAEDTAGPRKEAIMRTGTCT